MPGTMYIMAAGQALRESRTRPGQLPPSHAPLLCKRPEPTPSLAGAVVFNAADQGFDPAVRLRATTPTAATSPSTTEEMTGAVQIAEPHLWDSPDAAQGDACNDWLCVWCLHPVANEKDRCLQGDRSELRFRNPEGIWFRLITFRQAPGGRNVGVPTLEHTWFPGHAWSYCICASCRMHLGWFYSGPTSFVGLIKDRIVRAVTVRN